MTEAPWHRVGRGGRQAVLLIRHGRTAYNDQRRFLGVTDLPLDAEGLRQAEALKNVMPRLHALYTSPLARAAQTAAGLAPPHPVTVPALQELDQGHLEGLDAETARSRYPAFFDAWAADPGPVRPPGSADSFADLQARALGAVRMLAAAHPSDAAVAVVTHQLVIAGLSCAVAGQPLSAWRRYAVPNTGITVMSWDGSALALEEVGWTRLGPGPAGPAV